MNIHRSFKTLLLVTFSTQSALAFNPDAIAQCYQSAYPDAVQYRQPNLIVNGQSFKIEPPSKDFEHALNHATLADQLSQSYDLKFNPPSLNEDAGRLRHEAFFRALYGGDEKTIRQNLISITWQPSGKKLVFNQKQGAAQALAAVGKAISQHPDLVPYVAKSSGTFNYRFIAGTKRLSTHSFGIAIDFDLPHKLGRYWRWDKCAARKNNSEGVCPFPQELFKDDKLNQVVKIFEQHGFIWGGKWYHYDSVHFEYRPELLHKNCQSLGASL